ncbi:acetylserotonin O-methyltransferase [Crossiella sp. SN42]|uniref:acetylserotonin O-methyltransferase n=1 Tax=Crossiella sp. SN42 TaxID=2944808 RepID=UPI00207C47B6|nr:acetylserotonin O-methyltransferase [Crossiella sp. SN42]MCO1576638.1 acetylserotonin O-methyltransferase [Crossiella sp. SN42]
MSEGSAAAPSTPAELARLAFGFAYTHVLRVTLELGLPELLAEGPRELTELDAATETHPPSLSRLVRALVALGLAEERDGLLHLSELGQCLRREVPGSIRGVVELALDPVLSQAWTELTHTVRTGETAFDRVHGHGLFEHLDRDPAAAAAFHRVMAGSTRMVAPALAAAYDFSGVSTLVDVGGGDGTLLAALLTAHPHLRGTVYDTEAAVSAAPALLTAAGVADRAIALGGDFFTGVPEGADRYLLKSILHDWPDEDSVTILRHCRAAMRPEGRVVVIEPVLPVDLREPGALSAVMSDMQMLALTPGRERTLAEFSRVFADSGLALAEAYPLPERPEMHVLEARPV